MHTYESDGIVRNKRIPMQMKSGQIMIMALSLDLSRLAFIVFGFQAPECKSKSCFRKICFIAIITVLWVVMLRRLGNVGTVYEKVKSLRIENKKAAALRPRS